MADYKVGRFAASFTGPYPMYMTVRCDGQEYIKFTHRDLSDLQHMLAQAEKHMRKALGNDADEI